jgi:EAL domain-containing protein (putative c-di-GMP-specific phosphodiesterase class I)/GGDEF domain-containing protein
MRQFRLYDFVSRARWLNYRGKIMVMAFIGTHVPLLGIIALVLVGEGIAFETAIVTLAVALVATLVGTGVTLYVLNQLLRPIVATSKGLHLYRTERKLPDLPTHYTDEAGTLMADARHTLEELDTAIHELAHYDKVTGLPNRAALLAEMQSRAEAGRSFAIAALRLAGYDRLVAAFDQVTADRVLGHLAETLRRLATDRSFVARIEGGLFAVVTRSDGDIDRLSQRATEALAALGREIAVGEVRLVPRIDAGLALSPQDGVDPESLLDSAVSAIAGDEAATEPVRFFSPAARDAARRRFLTEQEIRRALDLNEFRLHYQPVVDTALGRVVGGEALVRWQHPERGLVGPIEFIPVAEASGLIDPIGRFVLGEACRQLRTLADAGRPDLKLAVNLSARQFRDPGLTDLIADTVKDHAVAEGRLELELTETAAMDDRARTLRILRELREMGLSIAIDDFGTGFSSMSNLLDLPFDRLKIDRGFVSGIDRSRNARAICAAVLALARNLNAKVLAEGVETGAEVRLLHDMGCRQFQGYYFSRAVPAVEFMAIAADLRLTADLMRASYGDGGTVRLSA